MFSGKKSVTYLKNKIKNDNNNDNNNNSVFHPER